MAVRFCLLAIGLIVSLSSGALAAADAPECRTVRIGDGGWPTTWCRLTCGEAGLRDFKDIAQHRDKLMTAILDQGQDGETAARAWLKGHPEVLGAWLEGVVGLEGQPAEPAVRKSLGV
jgi:ABC-type proline/glycine betaine transport system substrate-binding protein